MFESLEPRYLLSSQPVLKLSASILPENGTTVLYGGSTNPGSLDGHTVSIAWGDSTNETIALKANVLNFSQSHQYLDNRLDDVPYPITVFVTDKDGSTVRRLRLM